MLTDYIVKKLAQARYKIIEDGTYFGEIPGVRGVWANTKNLETCRKQLQEVLEDWLLFKVRAGENITGLKIKLPRSLVGHA